MATILLQAAGAYFGGFFGATAGVIGSAAGAAAGYILDRALISSTQRLEGPRLDAQRPFTAEDGAPLPRVYGTMRVSGTVIWATRFEEQKRSERQGAKGGPKLTTYSYFANVAFALCEGEIAGVRRIWADGDELDLDQIEFRVHRGGEDQDPDPLIAAKQEPGAVPAYRGTAYVVFERLPLDDYGNRVPQFQFEVIRPVGGLAERIRAVALIPGSTEFGLSTRPVTRAVKPGETAYLNRHMLTARTDFLASLDELQMLCPSLKHVALVVTWFGDDLRAGNCAIRPGVTEAVVPGLSHQWSVSGLSRDQAHMVSRHDGGAAYGGTPSDASVVEAIAELKTRGLSVTLYPFVMMDIAAENDLPDPHGSLAQPAYPWRGRITCSPGPGQAGSADKTATARIQVEAFCGDAAIGDFVPLAAGVGFSGPGAEAGYRRLILHYAHLAAVAGGVDSFLIGSELRGLTTVRDEQGAFPFVEQLIALAAEVKTVLGSGTRVTYAADWSEYFGHHPADGTGDVFFHLDPLWASPSIDAVGIDNYMPLSDWRDEDYGGGNPDGFRGPYDPAGLRAAITSGEGYDWYYPSPAARQARARAPISDGAHGKPWTYRYKDLRSWWSNPHHDRPGGVEKAEPTAWVPRSKPIWMTELGCPASDKGPNQPNVFPDTKSSEAAFPYFSNGGRADHGQANFLQAHLMHWVASEPDFQDEDNPLSPVYGGRMVDADRIYAWAWDARPFPAFPLSGSVWADGGNWLLGHWLNGRLSGAPAGAIIAKVLGERGLPAPDVALADGFCHGYVQAGPATGRDVLEPLLQAFSIGAAESGSTLRFVSLDNPDAAPAELGALIVPEDGTVAERVTEALWEMPSEFQLGFRDPLRDHQSASATAVVPSASSVRPQRLDLPGAIETGIAEGAARDWLRQRLAGRDSLRVSTTAGRRDLAPGRRVRLEGGADLYRIEQIEDGLVRRLLLRKAATPLPAPRRVVLEGGAERKPAIAGAPLALFLDLPMGMGATHPEDQLRLAVRASPWRAQSVMASPATTGFDRRTTVPSPASIGVLAAPLVPGPEGRFDRTATLTVDLLDGSLESVATDRLLAGANLMAVRSASGAWEVLQFADAEEIAASRWRLTNFLRGQGGTGDAAAAGAPAGAWAVLLDADTVPAGLRASEIGTALNWRVSPAGLVLEPGISAEATVTGGLRALTPLAPVHLRGRSGPEGLALSWIRRGRIDADSWLGTDIPLGEETEAYRVDIRDGDTLLRSTQTAEPAWTYPIDRIVADFGPLPASIDVAVRQISQRVGPGLPASKSFIVPNP